MTDSYVQATEIYKEIKTMMDGGSHIVTKRIDKNPRYVARDLRNMCKTLPQKVVVREVNEYRDNLFVIIKETDELEKLKSLLRKCMLEVDNEHLYDEIFSALYPNQ